MREAAAYIRQLQPDIICMQEAPDGAYYQADTVRKAFSYVPHHCVSGRTDHLPMMIGSRYPLQHIRTLYFKNSVNLAMIADVCMPTDTIRLFCNHLETTSVNQYRGQIQAASKPWMFRLKAGVKLILRMKENFRKRAAQADYIAEEIRRSPYPVVVCGDFNDTPASYAYHRMKGALTDGFRDAGRGYQYTFRQLKRIWRIDYIFYSDELKGLSYDSPDTPYSDHKMVVWRGCIEQK
nr:endonuclease/exonuclease/phosphatase family protein [Parabacteroides sp. AD58]